DAIGYGGTAYGDTTLVIHLRVEGHSPLEISPQSEQYPLSRYLYFLTITPPEGILKAYIDWVTGPDGQAIVSSVGYFPLW
ncbi:MAG TPA: phosphate ABC transporter substrate-binding protein, partial [Calditrichia bacterium]|nr:phosphate ABC transporter substrate-binding protein [Calditrichia bacterium]